MGYKPRWHPFIIFLITTTTSTSLSPLPQPPRSLPAPRNYALKPSITIIVGILTTIFSITFLILLYAKHCRRTPNRYPLVSVRNIARDNSGIDRTIIESLPVFRFGSLSGQKDGLECAVCLSVFDPSEVLRLLPKCKHAFHVECVDTWLDAHSTCPLCRYRVDPEDIFLIHEFSHNVVEIEEEKESPSSISTTLMMPVTFSLSRVSGRHSSAGEKVTGITSPAPSPPLPPETAAAVYSRRSLDSWVGKKKGVKKGKKKDVTSSDGDRKDGLLLERRRLEKRYEHRIVVGTERWSDVQPSDLLYLRSEMILSDVRRLKRSRPSVLHEGNNGWWQSGKGVINSRSVSEMTGLSRFGSNGEGGVVSRLLARLTEPRSGRNSSSSNV